MKMYLKIRKKFRNFSSRKNTMKPVIAETYLYPADEKQRNLCVLTLEALERPKLWCMERKNVIFVIDISASMLYTMPNIKASIRTFRDLICGRENSHQSPVTDERFRTTLPNFHLITFSDVSRLVWSNSTRQENGKSFDDTIDYLDVEGSTNMGAGIELAYSLCTDALASWIIVFTDGESNKGKFQSIEAFSQLENRKPVHSKIISLGYGTDFDAKILDTIGDFTYLQNQESIPGFMGALSHEVSTCGVIDVSIRNCSVDVIFGTPHPGWFSNERIYYFGFLDCERDTLEKESVVEYTEILPSGVKTSQTLSITVLEVPRVLPPLYVKLAIANFEASRLIKELYKVSCESKVSELRRKIKDTLTIVEKWGDEIAEPRETVRRICKELIQPKERNGGILLEVYPATLQLANNLITQTSYTNQTLQSPSSLGSTNLAKNLSNTYILGEISSCGNFNVSPFGV